MAQHFYTPKSHESSGSQMAEGEMAIDEALATKCLQQPEVKPPAPYGGADWSGDARPTKEGANGPTAFSA